MTDKEKKISLPVFGHPKPPWYQDGLHFECTQCGNCCSGGPGYVWVTDADIHNIAGFLNISIEAFARRYLRQLPGGISLTERSNYDCTFLDRSGGKSECKIYPVRPMQCRTWPFWKQNIQSAESWQKAARRCPGMRSNHGPRYSAEHIDRCAEDPESP